MTSLKGNLNSVDLANIFQMLSMNQREGTLYIFDGQSRKAIYFGHDGVSMLTRGKHRPDQLGRILIRFDKLTPEKLEDALRAQEKHSSRLLGQVLVEEGLVTRADVEEALKTQIEEEVYSLFIWKDAQFEFVEGPPDEEFRTHDGVTKLTFNVNSLIMEAAKRVDEWEWIQRVLPTTEEIFRYTGRNVGLDDEIFTQPFAGKVLAAIDGRRSVDEVVDASYAGRFEVTKILALLVEGGAVESLPVPELRSAASECVAAGDMAAAVKFLSRLVALKADTPEMHRQLAEAFEARKQLERAAFHYKVHGEVLADQGDRRGAFAVYKRIVDMLPTDLAAADRLVEIFSSNPEGLEEHAAWVVQLGKSTAESWVELRRQNRAIQLLHRVVSLGPDDADLRNRLVQVYLQCGMSADAIAEYDALAETAIAMRDFEQAEKIYRKILAIDRNREDAQAKLNQILSRRRSRQRGIRLAIAGGILLCGALYGGLEGWKWYQAEQYRAQEQANAFSSSYNDLRAKYVSLHTRIGESARELTAAPTDLEKVAAALLDGAPVRAELEKQAAQAAQTYFALAQQYTQVPGVEDATHAGEALQGKIRDLKSFEGQLRSHLVERVDDLWAEIDADWQSATMTDLDAKLRRLLGLARATPAWLAGPKGTKASELAGNVAAILRSWDECRAKVEAARAANDVTAWQDAYVAFLSEWLAPKGLVEEMRIPRTVTSRPAGARVLVDDVDDGLVTPCVIELPIHRASKLRFLADGFQEATIDVPALRPADKVRVREDLRLSFEGVLRKDVVLTTQGSPDRVAAAPVLSGDRIVVPTRGKALDLFEALKGGRKGSVAVAAKVRPADVDGILVVPAADKGVYFVRTADGQVVGREQGRGSFAADAISSGGNVIVADLDGHVTAYSPTARREAWRYPLTDDPGAGFATTPVADGDELFALAVDGRVTVLDTRTGAFRRRLVVKDGGVPVTLTAAVTPAGSELLSVVRGEGSRPSTVYGFDRQTGEMRWKLPVDGDVRGPVQVWQGVAYAVTTGGTGSGGGPSQLVCLRLSPSGAERTRTLTLTGQVRTDTLLEDGVLYVGDTSGTLTALDVRGSEPQRLWDFRLVGRDGKPSPVVTRPVLAGELILLADDTTVHGIRR